MPPRPTPTNLDVLNTPIGLAPGADLDAAGQDARKYHSRNPVVRRLLERWMERVRSETGTGVTRLLDVGVGEGFALRRLEQHSDLTVGVEYRLDKLRVAVEHTDLTGIRADAGMLPFPDRAFDLVLCTEVLEHLVRPAAAVRELARVTRGRCIVSVPWEPWFRLGNLARGKNVRDLGNDPEHVQHYSRRALESELRASFTSCSVDPCFPWIVAVATNHPDGRAR
jgi:SAM-dependent methyltransferase